MCGPGICVCVDDDGGDGCDTDWTTWGDAGDSRTEGLVGLIGMGSCGLVIVAVGADDRTGELRIRVGSWVGRDCVGNESSIEETPSDSPPANITARP